MNKLKFKHSEKLFLFLILQCYFLDLTGLYIFGYRIGELGIGFGIIFALVLSLSYFTKKKL